ncbi:MAG: biotin--[acetyl-CoA-carboxylase] ligase [Lachnospiraceae bacterium]
MGTKEKLLFLFETHKGDFFSGEEIAEKLSVSRTAVWKAVNSLRNEGYEIEAVPNKGYSLSVNTDILSAQGIRKYLNQACNDIKLHVLPQVEATNTLLREKANAGAKEGYTVIADEQTNGRGRRGRSFYSPKDTGIYMSLLLRPVGITPGQAIKITTMAAVAACEAIEEVSGKQTGIKWVNDIYMYGRKVSGILTEASFDMENGSLDYVVLGIGMNVYPPKGGFPKEIEQIAGTIFHESQNDGKNSLAAGFLNHFMSYYTAGENVNYVEKYRDRSLAVGKEVTVLSSNGGKRAVALDVDEECRLIVQYEDGRTERLSSGEISIRLS